MKQLPLNSMANVTATGDGAFWTGFICASAVFVAFTPAAPLSVGLGNGCIVAAIGLGLGKYN